MVGLGKENPFKYSITKYLYATSSVQVPKAFIVKSMSREAWSRKSNWIEFVVLGEISRLVDHYKTEEINITIAGHSMGASVGTLNAIDIVINRFNKVVAEKPSCPDHLSTIHDEMWNAITGGPIEILEANPNRAAEGPGPVEMRPKTKSSLTTEK
nr:phospholipase A1-IIgamma-like [Ipomoea batatas]